MSLSLRGCASKEQRARAKCKERVGRVQKNTHGLYLKPKKRPKTPRLKKTQKNSKKTESRRGLPGAGAGWGLADYLLPTPQKRIAAAATAANEGGWLVFGSIGFLLPTGCLGEASHAYARRDAIIATSYCFARARAPPRRFFLAGGLLASGLVAVVVAVEGETTGDGAVLRASHLAASAARNLGMASSRSSVVGGAHVGIDPPRGTGKQKREKKERTPVRMGSKPRAHKRHPPREGDHEVYRE